MTSFGYVQDGKVFRKGFFDHPDKEIGEVKEDESSSLAYFEQRFDQLIKKVDELEEKINNSQNKGSFLMKLLHLKEHLHEQDAIGDFESLHQRLEQLEAHLNELIADNRRKNLEVKKAYLEEAHAIVTLPDWKEATEKLLELKKRWIRVGNVVKEQQEDIEQQFQEILNNFFERKKSFFEDKAKLIEEQAAQYKALVAEAKQWSGSEDMETAVEKLKDLQKQWKALPKIPKKLHDEIREEFNQINDTFFKKYKSARKEVTEKANEEFIKQKEAIIEGLENMAPPFDEKDKEKLSNIKRQWMQGKKLPRKQMGELNARFDLAFDMVKERMFLDNLANNKASKMKNPSEDEVQKLKIKLLKDLLGRDQRELSLFQENMEKFNMGSAQSEKMLSGNLKMQQHKIKVKKKLLEQLQDR